MHVAFISQLSTVLYFYMSIVKCLIVVKKWILAKSDHDTIARV